MLKAFDNLQREQRGLISVPEARGIIKPNDGASPREVSMLLFPLRIQTATPITDPDRHAFACLRLARNPPASRLALCAGVEEKTRKSTVHRIRGG